MLSSWRAIDSGVTPQTTKDRQKYWAAWVRYARQWKVDPFLQQCDPLDGIVVVAAFASRVRSGYYGHGVPIKVSSVTTALAAISATLQLVGKPCPFKTQEDKYVLPISRLVEGLKRDDAPAVPQLALPITVPEHICKVGIASTNALTQAVGDLCIIAFYFLLRVGEYTAPRFVRLRNGTLKRATRTRQFQVQDVGFWKDGRILPRASPLAVLLTADAATLKITNQKNGKMGETIHHESFDSALCPVKALARRIHHILNNGGGGPSYICEYKDPQAPTLQTVTPKHMITAIRAAVVDLEMHKAGIDPSLVGDHSLRAGGAMALKLHGESDTTIMKLGRWKSLTFLMYIHNQIGHLSKDLSHKMSRPIPFLNIAAIESTQP